MNDFLDALAFCFAVLIMFGIALTILLAVVWGLHLFIWMLP